MSEIIRKLLIEFKEHLAALYGERLKGVYLFGSYARGEADEESDVDVLIVLDQVKHYGQEVDHTGEISASLSLEYGKSISCVFVPEEKWHKDQTLFFLNVREEAIAA